MIRIPMRVRRTVATVAAVADPTEAGRLYCQERGLPWHASHHALLEAGGVEALIIATPNQSHLDIGLAAIARQDVQSKST